MAKETTVDKRQLAARWSVSERTVERLVAAGMPHVGAGRNLRVNVAEAENWRNLHAPPQLRMKPVNAGASAGDGNRSRNEYGSARAMRERYKAKMQKLEFERLSGKLLDGDRVLEEAEKAFSNVRVRLRGLPRSLAPVLANMGNRPADIEAALLTAIDGALESLSADVFASQMPEISR